MGDIGQNLQLPSDGSEILCAIRAPHKAYAYQIVTKYVIFGKLWEKISVPDITNLGLHRIHSIREHEYLNLTLQPIQSITIKQYFIVCVSVFQKYKLWLINVSNYTYFHIRHMYIYIELDMMNETFPSQAQSNAPIDVNTCVVLKLIRGAHNSRL